MSDVDIKVLYPSRLDGGVDFDAVVVVDDDVDQTSFVAVVALNGSDCWHCSEPVVVPDPSWQ